MFTSCSAEDVGMSVPYALFASLHVAVPVYIKNTPIKLCNLITTQGRNPLCQTPRLIRHIFPCVVLKTHFAIGHRPFQLISSPTSYSNPNSFQIPHQDRHLCPFRSFCNEVKISEEGRRRIGPLLWLRWLLWQLSLL
jgi:hypothetical protein